LKTGWKPIGPIAPVINMFDDSAVQKRRSSNKSAKRPKSSTGYHQRQISNTRMYELGLEDMRRKKKRLASAAKKKKIQGVPLINPLSRKLAEQSLARKYRKH